MIDHICNKCGEPLDPANWWTVRIGDRFVSSTYKLCDGCAALADYTMRSMMGKGQVRKADANDTDAVSAEGSAGAVFVDGVQVFPPKALEHVKDSSEKLDADAASVSVSSLNETANETGNADSRAKLEADANAIAIDYWHRKRTWGDANDLKRDVTALLDRQAAITAEETRCKWVVATADEIARLRDENMNLARDLGECMADRDRYRELCGQMLDAAHEIRRIADANMPEVAKEVLK